MAFEGLSERLQSALAKLRGKGKVSEADVKVAMREVRLALLEADVNYKVVKDFVSKVRERAVGQEVLKSLTPGQQVIKVVNEELSSLMGGTQEKLNLTSKPSVILMVGLQGRGKPPPPESWDVSSKSRTGIRFLWRVTSTVRLPSGSWKSSETRWSCRSSPWGTRKARSGSPSTGWPKPRKRDTIPS